MPPASTSSKPLLFIHGDDDFGVKQRAKACFQTWSKEPGVEAETIDGTAGNSGEALRALSRLREALQTLPFFGEKKVIWLQNCNFLGDDRTASAQAVTEFLGDLAKELKSFDWSKTRLLISAGKVDKRKTFFKTLEKLGDMESFVAWSVDDRDWSDKAELSARRSIRELGKDISEDALGELVARVGPNMRQLQSEIEKLALYTGTAPRIELKDVETITTKNKQAQAFALGDAFGDRNLPRALRRLDEELWSMKFDTNKSEIGLLYGLISKVRVLIFLKELLKQGRLKAENDYNRFKGQLERLPADLFPEDKRFNPLSMNAYILFKSLPQARNYSLAELTRAMGQLLECNRRLVGGSNTDGAIVLQQTVTEILGSPVAGAA
jgi:DNA polymerase-3 subunit delta